MFYVMILMIYKKGSCMNFSGVVIISHEVMKVESFEATKCGIQHDP